MDVLQRCLSPVECCRHRHHQSLQSKPNQISRKATTQQRKIQNSMVLTSAHTQHVFKDHPKHQTSHKTTPLYSTTAHTPAMERASREAKREFRKRGSARRELDLNDLILDLPPPPPVTPRRNTSVVYTQNESEDAKEDESEEELEEEKVEVKEKNPFDTKHVDTIPELPPPDVISDANARILAKHKQIVEERLEQRKKKKQAAVKHKKSSKSISMKRIATVKAKSIRIKYRRIPTNKSKLLYTDVISQMIKDYIKSSPIIDRYSSNVSEDYKKLKRTKRGKKVVIPTDKEIRSKSKKVLKEYYDRVDEYFNSLIDLQLSNSLIRNDLDRINAEKNSLRLQIFDVRKDLSSIDLEIKQIRDEFRNLNIQYSNQDKIYKQLIRLKEGDESVKQFSENSITEQIEYRLNKLETNLDQRVNQLDSIKLANGLLSKIIL